MNLLEILLRLRDEASAKLRTARGEVQKTREIVTALAPALGRAGAQMEGFASAGLAFGPAGVAVAGFAVSVGAATAATVALAREVEKLASSAEQLTNLAQKTGVAAEALQGFQFAFQNAGVPVEALNTGLRFLARNIAESAPELRQLGITTTNVGEAFLQLSDIFANAQDGANKTAFAVKLLGRSGSDLIPVMNGGAEALRAAAREAEGMGRVLGPGALETLSRADEQFDELRQRVEGLKAQMVLLAAPAISGLVRELNRLLSSLLALPKAFADAKQGLSLLLDTVPGGKQLQDFLAYVRALERLAKAARGGEKTGREGGIDPATGGPWGGVTGPEGPPLPTPGAAAPWGGSADILRGLIMDTSGSAKLREAAAALKVVGGEVQVVTTRLTEFGQALDVLEQFRAQIGEVLDFSNILGETLEAVWGSLETSLTTVFQGLLSKGQTFKSAMATIFRGMVDAILAELARLAAAAIFRFLLKIVGAILTNGASLAAEGAVAAAGATLPAPGQAAAAGPVTNVYLSALDAQSFEDFYRSRGGGARVYGSSAARRSRYS